MIKFALLLLFLASAAETKELAALDDLLAKAQKVREIQLKVCENSCANIVSRVRKKSRMVF